MAARAETEYYGLKAIAARLGYKDERQPVVLLAKYGLPLYRRPVSKRTAAGRRFGWTWYTTEELIRWWQMRQVSEALDHVATLRLAKRLGGRSYPLKPRRLEQPKVGPAATFHTSPARGEAPAHDPQCSSTTDRTTGTAPDRHTKTD